MTPPIAPPAWSPPSLLAHVAAWLAATGFVVVARHLDPAMAPTRSVALEAVHLLQALFGAWVAFGLGRALARARELRAPLRHAIVGALVGGASYLVLADDVARRAALWARAFGGPPWGYRVALASAIGACVFAWGLIQVRLARRSRAVQLACAACGVGVVLLARSIDPSVYPGVRLAIQLGAAFGIATALHALAHGRSRSGWAPHVVCAIATLAAVSLESSPALQRAVVKTEASGVAPLLARARWQLVRGLREAPEGSVRGAPSVDVPSSRPPLLATRTPVVVMVTVDALRADVVFSRRHDTLLPTLARLRDSSIAFTHARTVAPSTLVTIDGLFSSRMFGDAGRTDESELLEVATGAGAPARLSDRLRASGVRTTIVRCAGWLDPNLVSFGKVDQVVRPPIDARGKLALADDIVSALIAEIDDHAGEAHFLYAHLLEAHEPYDLAGPEGAPFERYLRELALVDAALGRLEQALRRPGLEDRAVLIVSADHGEAFGEQGAHGHAAGVYESVIRVPLLIRAPVVPPRVVAEAVTLLDVAPTILDLFAVATAGSMLGTSLGPTFLGGGLPERSIPIESGRGIQALVLPSQLKAIVDTRTGTVEVYDLLADPEELVDLHAGGRAPPAARAALDAFFSTRRTLRSP